MKFSQTPIHGAYTIELEPFQDQRGFFARSWCKKEFKKYGLAHNFVQCNISCNKKKGTVRGMHYQTTPHQEIKLVHCIQGSVYDVIIDLRKDSPSYLQWFGTLISFENKKMVYIPAGCAHGYQSLQDNSAVYYHVSNFYAPSFEKGIHWKDPLFSIQWPIKNAIVSEKDNNFPFLSRTILPKTYQGAL